MTLASESLKNFTRSKIQAVKCYRLEIFEIQTSHTTTAAADYVSSVTSLTIILEFGGINRYALASSAGTLNTRL